MTETNAHSPEASTGMRIRRPVSEVFEAFVDPAITTRFWFTSGSGRLEPGTQVVWKWEMYGAEANVRVREIEPDRRLLIEWWSGDEPATTVEWIFQPLGDNTTFVTITNRGFQGSIDDQCRQLGDSAGGFSFALAGAKAWLEHGIELNLTGDRFPVGLMEG